MLTLKPEYLNPRQSDFAIITDYNVEDLPLLVAKQDLLNIPKKQTTPHWNKDLEIVYIRQGSMMLTVNGDLIRLNEGDIFFIEPGSLHFFQHMEDCNCIYYVSLINESLFFASPLLTKKYINHLYHNIRPKGLFFPKGSELHETLYQVLADFYRILDERPVGFELLVAAKCYQLLVPLFTVPTEELEKIGSIDLSTAECLRCMLDYIKLNYQRKISTEQLCQAGNVSRNNCFKLFHDFLGESPATAITKYRLNQSLTLLSDNSLSILEVAMSCGFAQQSHFTHHFTRVYNMTPSQFRKKQKESR